MLLSLRDISVVGCSGGFDSEPACRAACFDDEHGGVGRGRDAGADRVVVCRRPDEEGRRRAGRGVAADGGPVAGPLPRRRCRRSARCAAGSGSRAGERGGPVAGPGPDPYDAMSGNRAVALVHPDDGRLRHPGGQDAGLASPGREPVARARPQTAPAGHLQNVKPWV